MSTKLGYLRVISLLILGFLVGIQGVSVVHAQSASPASSCLTCHKDQYYLHDSGKWYCITEAKERCINCHAGVPDTAVKEDAHRGLVANPLSDGGQRCQTCHVQDAEMFVQRIVSQMGYHSPVNTDAYIPQASLPAGLPALLPDSTDTRAPIWFASLAIAVFAFWVRLVIHTSRA